LTPARLYSTDAQNKTSISNNPNKNPLPNPHFLAYNPKKSYKKETSKNQRARKVGFLEDMPTKNKAFFSL